jgi:hypothetical protein
VTLERLNELIRLFGEHEKAALRAEKRGGLRSPLFDLLRRSLLGWQLKYRHETAFLREVAEVLTPEEVGRRMKVPGSRPYYLQLFLMLQDTLGARQQRMLELGLAEGDPLPGDRVDDLLFLADFWERTCLAYRNDGKLFPDAEQTQPILADESLAEVLALLRPAGGDALQPARTMLATLDGYAFLAHGEQRDGIFAHGAYAGSGDTVVFLKEVNDLRSDFLPWVQTETRNPYGNVVFAYACRDVRVAFDFFGGVVTDPLEFHDRVEGFAVLTQEGGRVREIPPGEWPEIRDAAAAATSEMYFRIMEWPDRFKTEYGAWLFANHVKPFLDLAGIDANERLAAAVRDTVDAHLDEVLAGPEVPLTMVHWGTTDGPLFWPVVA